MQSYKSVLSSTALMVIGLTGAQSVLSQPVVQKQEVRVINRIYQILDKDMVKVTFDENSANISDSSMTAVTDFVKATAAESKVERYLVAAWADKEIPAKGQLSSGQQKLATSRANRLQKALGAAGATNIGTFEMTSQPNWIQKTFSTETAEIKGKGLSVTDNEILLKEIGQKIRNNGGPRTAVIIAKF